MWEKKCHCQNKFKQFNDPLLHCVCMYCKTVEFNRKVMQDCRPVVFISDSLQTVLNWQSVILNIKQNRLTAHNAYFCITLMVHISAICRFTDRLLARPRTEIRTRDWRSIIIISIILLRIEILTFSQSQMEMLNYWAISDGNAELLSYLWWKCSTIELSLMEMLNYWVISDGNAHLLSYLWWKCSPIELSLMEMLTKTVGYFWWRCSPRVLAISDENAHLLSYLCWTCSAIELSLMEMLTYWSRKNHTKISSNLLLLPRNQHLYSKQDYETIHFLLPQTWIQEISFFRNV